MTFTEYESRDGIMVHKQEDGKIIRAYVYRDCPRGGSIASRWASTSNPLFLEAPADYLSNTVNGTYAKVRAAICSFSARRSA